MIIIACLISGYTTGFIVTLALILAEWNYQDDMEDFFCYIGLSAGWPLIVPMYVYMKLSGRMY